MSEHMHIIHPKLSLYYRYVSVDYIFVNINGKCGNISLYLESSGAPGQQWGGYLDPLSPVTVFLIRLALVSFADKRKRKCKTSYKTMQIC
jgi:hypothetical protein